jgi:hypothetical protein
MPSENINPNLPSITSNLPPILQHAYAEQLKRGPVDPQALARINSSLENLEHGYHAMVPLMCHGSACPMAAVCPLYQNGFTYMINKLCPIEQHLMSTYTSKIMEVLKIDPDNHVEVMMAGELAKIDIYEMRLNHRMSNEDFIKQQVIGVDDEGVPLYREELHVAAQWDETLSKRKLKYLDSLLATRKSAAGAGAGIASDPSTQAANIKRLLDKKTRELRETAEDITAERAKDVTPPRS